MHCIRCILVLGFVLVCFVIPGAADEDGREWEFSLEAGASLYLLKMPDYAPIHLMNTFGAVDYGAIAVYDDDAKGVIENITLGLETPTPLFFEASGRYFCDYAHVDGTFSPRDYPPSPANNVGYYQLTGNFVSAGTARVAWTSTDVSFF